MLSVAYASAMGLHVARAADCLFCCHLRWAAEGGADGVRRVVGREIMELGYGLATGFPVPLGYAPRDALSWPRRGAERRRLAPPRITRPEVSPCFWP